MESPPRRSSGEFPAASPRVVELCCLLWARSGCEDALTAYEDTVLAYVAEHGGRVISRAIGPGTDGTPHETHCYWFPTQSALDAYLGDPRREALAAERDRVIARTVLYPVRIAVPPV